MADKRLEEYLDMFLTPGWGHLMRATTERLDALKAAPRGIDSLLELGRWQGRIESLEALSSLERSVRLEIEGLESLDNESDFV